jgi:hypothetical protein
VDPPRRVRRCQNKALPILNCCSGAEDEEDEDEDDEGEQCSVSEEEPPSDGNENDDASLKVSGRDLVWTSES